jgi:hypothetical protein
LLADGLAFAQLVDRLTTESYARLQFSAARESSNSKKNRYTDILARA